MTFHIRDAAAGDCRGIAEVQVDSYLTAYAGMFPPAYFAHFTYEDQAQDWRQWLVDRPDDTLMVAVSAEAGIIGYILARPETDAAGYDAEIVALHVRRLWQGQGIGRALLTAASRKLGARGCRSVMLWTLKANPVREWYERLGGALIGEKSFQVDEREVTEVAYGWSDIAALSS